MTQTPNVNRLSGHHPSPAIARALIALILGSLAFLGCATGPATLATKAPSTTMPGPIVLSWTTAGEHQTYGYFVYRGRSVDGPFERVHQDIIPAAGTTDLAQRYTYVDDDAAIGVQYFYFVESVSLQGTNKRLTPVKSFTRKPTSKAPAEKS